MGGVPHWGASFSGEAGWVGNPTTPENVASGDRGLYAHIIATRQGADPNRIAPNPYKGGELLAPSP